jgi:DNA-binding transcriptional LysR family regulator
VLEAYEELEKSMENLEQRTALRVGSSITIANFWLPGIISRFSKHAPDVPVEVAVDSAWRTSQRLEANEIDMAFIEGASYQEKFDSISFSSYQVIPLCAPDYFKERLFHWGERGESGWTLPPRALSEERLLLREKGSAIRDVFDGAMIQQDLKLSASWVSVNSQTLLHAAEAGLGITFLPDRLAEEWLEKGRLITFSLKGISLKNENHLALLKGKYISEPMKLFIRLAQDPELF